MVYGVRGDGATLFFVEATNPTIVLWLAAGVYAGQLAFDVTFDADAMTATLPDGYAPAVLQVFEEGGPLPWQLPKYNSPSEMITALMAG